jgi:FKBP-type peptidyl-prolyl cis-trans isomerase FklB
MLSYSFVLFLFATILLVSSVAADDKKKGDVNSYLKRTGAKFLEEVAQREGVIELKSGMLVEILKTSDKSDAKSPTVSDNCEVTYSGTLKDGSKFDAGTTSFAPNQVIKGWTEAMQLMAEGDKWKLYIPYNLAYGERGSPPRIPAYAPLVFEIEIHKVKAKGKSVEEARKAFEEAKKPAAQSDL